MKYIKTLNEKYRATDTENTYFYRNSLENENIHITGEVFKHDILLYMSLGYLNVNREFNSEEDYDNYLSNIIVVINMLYKDMKENNLSHEHINFILDNSDLGDKRYKQFEDSYFEMIDAKDIKNKLYLRIGRNFRPYCLNVVKTFRFYTNDLPNDLSKLRYYGELKDEGKYTWLYLKDPIIYYTDGQRYTKFFKSSYDFSWT